jgi:membrane protein
MEKAPDKPVLPRAASESRTGLRVRSVAHRMRTFVENLATVPAQNPDGTLRKRVFYPVYVLRILIATIRQWVRDRCPQQASSLAFQTALSLVPIIAMTLAVLRATGSFEASSSLVDFVSTQVIPISRREISETLLTYAGNFSVQTTGFLGFLVTLLLSFLMFNSIENIFNDVWRVEKRRSLGQMFVVFYLLITIVPCLLGISLYHAARYGLTSGWWGALGALASTFGGLLFANKLLPATRVRWAPAAIGALLSALAFEAAKHLFRLYVAKVAFQKSLGVYGALGLVPLFLVWIYYSWLVILLGAEVAHTVQNLQHLERLDRRGRLSPENEIFEKVNGVVAARLLVAIVEAWIRGEKGVTRRSLASRFDLTEEAIDRIMRRLKDRDLVLEVDGDATGYLPARAPSEITLAEVFAPFRGADVLATRKSGSASRLDEVLHELDEQSKGLTSGVTLDELLRK